MKKRSVMDLIHLIQALSEPSAYPHPVGGVEVRHTHISVVFLAGSVNPGANCGDPILRFATQEIVIVGMNRAVLKPGISTVHAHVRVF
jgi:hypothetical protein